MLRELENHSFGFICLYRSIQKNWVWEDAEKLKWWLDILMTVNHAEAKVLIKGTLLQCNRGESLYSLQTWAKRWRTNVSAVRRFFALLQIDGMIELKSEGKTTRLTVCNYESYNSTRHEGDTKVKRKKTETETPARPVATVLDLYTEEQRSGFQKFQAWIVTNAPSVSKMKEPFTIDEYLKLKSKHNWQKIASLLEAMDGWEPLLIKRKNAYKTFNTFNKREQEKTAAA